MGVNDGYRQIVLVARRCAAPLVMLLAAVALATSPTHTATGGPRLPCRPVIQNCPLGPCEVCEGAGTWYWLRSPDEEKRAVAALYNRYCIRCHGVDGRGVWDIPDVPNFTNPRWQACRSDGQLARIILEGHGAVMPPFRGTLSLEEACGMARYLRGFVPGTEISRPVLDKSEKPAVPPPHGPKPAGPLPAAPLPSS